MLTTFVKMLVLIAVCLALVVDSSPRVSAADLANRSLRVSNSIPSEGANYRFSFRIATIDMLGSIEFEFCENDPLVGFPCTSPVGLDLSSAALTTQTGQTGFSIDPSSTSSKLILSRTPGLSSLVPVTYVFSNVTNPSDIGTYYVRLSTFASNDATGPRTDKGGLAFSINRSITINSYVPPYLTFCVGVTVAGDCSSANGNQLNFGELTTGQASTLTSQFAGATNDPGGFTTYINGLTMTSGTNFIPALSSPGFSKPGTSQFGMNLRSNSSPAAGANPSGIGDSIIKSDYNQPNKFVFKDQAVTSSSLSTDFNLFTATYVVNVSENQRPGIYTTTLTYTAVASF